MRFYFCDSCEKRISSTDSDALPLIDENTTKNYCSDCRAVMERTQSPTSESKTTQLPEKQNVLESIRCLVEELPCNRDAQKFDLLYLWVVGGTSVTGILIAISLHALAKPTILPNTSGDASQEIKEVQKKNSEKCTLPSSEKLSQLYGTTDSRHAKTTSTYLSQEFKLDNSQASPLSANLESETAYLVLDSYLVELLGALKKMDYEQATECCTSISNDFRLEPIREAIQQFPSLIDTLAERQKLIQAQLKSLIGKDLEVKSFDGTAYGKVFRVSGDLIILKNKNVSSEISGSPLVIIAFSSLTLKEQDRLAPGSMPLDSRGEVAMALQYIANNELSESQELLDKNAKHPVVKLLSERAAMFAWNAFLTLSIEARTNAQAKVAICALNALEQNFASTAVIRSRRDEAKAIRARLNEVILLEH